VGEVERIQGGRLAEEVLIGVETEEVGMKRQRRRDCKTWTRRW